MTDPQEKILNRLAKWIHKNNVSYLTWRLGYEDTAVIKNWLKRKHIPFYMVDNLLNVLEDERTASDLEKTYRRRA